MFNYAHIFVGQDNKSVFWTPLIPSPLQHQNLTPLHETTVHRM